MFCFIYFFAWSFVEQIGFIWAKFPVAGDIEDYIRKKNPDADIRRL